MFCEHFTRIILLDLCTLSTVWYTVKDTKFRKVDVFMFSDELVTSSQPTEFGFHLRTKEDAASEMLCFFFGASAGCQSLGTL
jgi:hypothetical protein